MPGDNRQSDLAPYRLPPGGRAPGVTPAWLGSLGLHFVALLLLALAFPSNPEKVAPEVARSGGIVLVQRSVRPIEYFADDQPPQNHTHAEAVRGSESFPRLVDQRLPPTLAGPGLPAAQDPGLNLPALALVPSAGELTEGTRPARARGVGEGLDDGVQTQVFGLQGRGSRFVYVFDRSSSMGDHDGRPLAAAKRELLTSLQNLGDVQQFQIIFYNQEPHLMSFAPGQAPGMIFGNDEGKRLATSFVRGIHADGATAHVPALTVALRMSPDVVFFLTDADEPAMTPDDLARIRRLNRGTAINAIEFGNGPQTTGQSFLRQLAEENGGQHVYIDITRLPPIR